MPPGSIACALSRSHQVYHISFGLTWWALPLSAWQRLSGGCLSGNSSRPAGMARWSACLDNAATSGLRPRSTRAGSLRWRQLRRSSAHPRLRAYAGKALYLPANDSSAALGSCEYLSGFEHCLDDDHPVTKGFRLDFSRRHHGRHLQPRMT